MICLDDVPKSGQFLVSVYEDNPRIAVIKSKIEKFFQTHVPDSFICMQSLLRCDGCRRSTGSMFLIAYNGLTPVKMQQIHEGLGSTFGSSDKWDISINQPIDEFCDY